MCQVDRAHSNVGKLMWVVEPKSCQLSIKVDWSHDDAKVVNGSNHLTCPRLNYMAAYPAKELVSGGHSEVMASLSLQTAVVLS